MYAVARACHGRGRGLHRDRCQRLVLVVVVVLAAMLGVSSMLVVVSSSRSGRGSVVFMARARSLQWSC